MSKNMFCAIVCLLTNAATQKVYLSTLTCLKKKCIKHMSVQTINKVGNCLICKEDQVMVEVEHDEICRRY